MFLCLACFSFRGFLVDGVDGISSSLSVIGLDGLLCSFWSGEVLRPVIDSMTCVCDCFDYKSKQLGCVKNITALCKLAFKRCDHWVWPLRLPLQLPLHLHKHCVTITFAITITRWQPHERVNHQVWPDWPLTECINVNMHNSCIVESLHSWINVMHSWLHNLCLGPFELSRKHHQRHNYRDIRPCATVHI